ncbi:hypothetical protein [Nemorincola caseinilytica]|uniref:hypothetical protein n=1 Tax=Nemorincola caseinilytica TaxID=2054315 RepID=UPI0031EF4AB1
MPMVGMIVMPVIVMMTVAVAMAISAAVSSRWPVWRQYDAGRKTKACHHYQ